MSYLKETLKNTSDQYKEQSDSVHIRCGYEELKSQEILHLVN